MTRRPQAVIYDRDGTLASVDYCRPLDRADGTPREVAESWRIFNGMLPLDPLVPAVAADLRADHAAGLTVIMFSGRSEGDRPGDTSRRLAMLDWIRKNDLPIDQVFMRAAGDLRADDLIKSDFLDRVLVHYDVLRATDDRASVCAMWRRRGIPLRQVVDPCLTPPLFVRAV